MRTLTRRPRRCLPAAPTPHLTTCLAAPLPTDPRDLSSPGP